MMVDRVILEQLTRKLVDEGKLIEAGWASLRLHAISSDASALQLEEMRMAFMAGAQHLFGSIAVLFDESDEVSEEDMRRIDLIYTELEAFRDELELRVTRTEGHA